MFSQVMVSYYPQRPPRYDMSYYSLNDDASRLDFLSNICTRGWHFTTSLME